MPDYVVQDARMFTLLTTLPSTVISSYTLPSSTSDSLRSAVFSLSIADNRYVTWECQLTNTGTWDGGLVVGLTTVPTAGSVGTSTGWEACTDPQVWVSCHPSSLTGNAHSCAKNTARVMRCMADGCSVGIIVGS